MGRPHFALFESNLSYLFELPRATLRPYTITNLRSLRTDSALRQDCSYNYKRLSEDCELECLTKSPAYTD